MARSVRLAIGLVLVSAALGAPATAWAGSRYAIVIGSNEGEQDEPVLRFAERDAQRMTEVLTRLGNVKPEDVLTLLSPTGDEVARALGSFRARVAAANVQAGAMVLVYYSGHADERALHLGGTRFTFDRLKTEVRALGADLSIFVVDACRSGGLLRVKGATPTQLFAFDVQDGIAAEGTAIITSSAETEDAQESDHLGGGVFTHHLLTGLSGAADRSGDQRVSLAEAYRYAYAQTIASTSTTRIVQHPTYAFDVEGQNEIILTNLDQANGRGRLRLPDAGQYLVFARGGADDLVAELEAIPGTDLWLRPGSYLVRRRDDAAVYESAVAVRAEDTTAVPAASLARVPYRHAVRKGYGLSERSVLSLGASVEFNAPIIKMTGLVVGGAVGLQLDLASLALEARVRYGRSSHATERITVDQGILGVDLGLFHLFDVGRHGVGFGVRGGLAWLAQRFETEGRAPDVDQLIGRVGPLARLELALGSSLTLTLDAGAEVYILEIASEQINGGTNARANAVFSVGLGLSGALP